MNAITRMFSNFLGLVYNSPPNPNAGDQEKDPNDKKPKRKSALMVSLTTVQNTQ
jgi:hypothetical protein